MNKSKQTLLFQETNTFNKPTILINVVKSKYLTLKDKKIYNVLLRQLINQKEEIIRTGTIKTSISQICYELGIKNRNEVPETLEKLRKTDISFNTKFEGQEIKFDTSLIVGQGVYKRNEESVIIEFSSILTNEVLQHYKRYAKLDIEEINRLKIGHSMTLYELIKGKLYTYNYQKQNYTEKELRKYLNLEDKYKDIKTFNKNVVKKMINDISEHTELTITLLKQSKKDNVRTYHLEVKRSGYNITLSVFRKTMRYLTETNQISFTYKIGKNKYSLEEQMGYNELDDSKILWLHLDSGKTLDTDKAELIWDKLFISYMKGPVKFVEEILNLDTDIFFNQECKYVK